LLMWLQTDIFCRWSVRKMRSVYRLSGDET